MSWQKTMINFVLRTFIKPLIAKTETNLTDVIKQRKGMVRFMKRRAIPQDIHLEAMSIAGVDVEYVAQRDVYQQLETRGHGAMRVLLYFHGGAFITCGPSTHRSLTMNLARRTRCEVYAVDYRKAPEHPFPAALEDTTAVYKALLDKGYRPDQIIFGGDSAGGNLVFTTLLKAKSLDLPMPNGAFAISPWTDLTISGDSYTTNDKKEVMLPTKSMHHVLDMILAGHDASDPFVSPIFGDFSGCPPILLHVGSTEILLSDALRVKTQLTRDKVQVTFKEWEDTPHVLPLFQAIMPEAAECVSQIVAFMQGRYAEASTRERAEVTAA